MPNIGPFELLIILVLALLILGPGKLPDVGAALGKTIREFRKASSDVQESMRLDAQPPATAQPAGTAAPAAPAEAPAATAVTAAAPTGASAPSTAEPAAPASAEDQAAHIRMLEARLAALEEERQAERPASDR